MTYADDGRSYTWEGKIVGAGEMQIVGEDAMQSITYKLTFLKPWKSVCDVGFEFTEKDGGVEATWSMDGTLPFFLFFMKLLFQNTSTNIDTSIADVNAGTGDELFHFCMALATEGTHSESGSAGHRKKRLERK